MKKVLSFVLTFLMMFSFLSSPNIVKADENTSLLSYYNVSTTSNSITVTWSTNKSYNYSTVYFKLASDSSTTSGITVYPSGGTYSFTTAGLKPNTDYLICVANSVPQHMLHRTVTTNACQHTNHSNDTYVRTRYVNNGSSTTHNRIDVYRHSCTNCGYNLGEIEVAPVSEDHTFSGNSCTKCGYTRACTHQNHSNDRYVRTEYSNANSNNHTRADIYTHSCTDCGYNLGEFRVSPVTEDHTYNGNSCTKCGYTRACTHQNHSNDRYVWTEYSNINSSNHTRTDVYTHSCTDCGYNLGEFRVSPFTESHNFSGNSCTKCGYARMCTHFDYTDNYLLTYTKNLNANTHQVIDVYSRVCKTCGVKIKEIELKSTKTHNFAANDLSNHKCSDCGYIESHVGEIGTCSKCGWAIYKPLRNGVSILGWAKVYGYDALQLAREGRLYVTDSKGQIYKKTKIDEDIFDDVYIDSQTKYSVDSVYILIGTNNLVLNKNTSSGNIITSVKPELIPQINTRLKTFDTIISGAQSAYNSKTITKSRQDQIIADANNLKTAFINAKKGNISSTFVNEINTKYVAMYSSSGETVGEIQQKLLDLGYKSQLVTGYYLDKTFNNVCYFQIANELRVTGFVDSETFNKINEKWSKLKLESNPSEPIKQSADYLTDTDYVMGLYSSLLTLKSLQVSLEIAKFRDKYDTFLQYQSPLISGKISYTNYVETSIEEMKLVIFTNPKFYSNYALNYDDDRMIQLVGDVSQNYVNELISRTMTQYGTIISMIENERRARVIKQGVSFTIDVLDLPGLAKSVTEVIANKNLITGEKLTEKEQWVNLGLSSVPFIPTALLKTANITSKTIDGAKALECIDMATDISKVSNVLSDSSKLLLPTPEEFGKLTYIGDKLYTHSSNVNPVRKWVSSKGLVYGYDRDFGNRVLHILSHTKKDTSKIKHTIFKLNKNEILKTIDEAWMMKGNPLPNDPGAYIINMGKIIGTNGETLIKIVVKPGTADILTAYPIK